MATVLIIDVSVLGVLVALALAKGMEAVLPVFAFIITLVPGESRILLFGFFELTTARLATALLLALYVATARRAGGEEQKPLPLRLTMTLLLACSLVSTLASVDLTASIKTALSNALDFYVLYYIVARTVKKPDTVEKILGAFVAGLTVSCVFGLLEIYLGWRVISLFPAVTHHFTAGENGLAPDLGRVKSTFPHPILFGNALVLGVPWAFYLLTFSRTALKRVWLWGAIALMFWNLYKTMSRGPWLALAVSLVFLFAVSTASMRKRLAVTGLLVVFVLVARSGIWSSITATYDETLDVSNPRGSSYQYRYDLMNAAKAKLATDSARAVWGFGPGSFFDLDVEGVDSTTGKPKKFESCDSAFVDVMLGSGYVGLLLVIALLCQPALVSLAGFRRLPNPANLLCLVFFTNVVAFAFMMLSVMNWGWGQQSYMIWIVFALAMGYPKITQTVPELAQQGDVGIRGYESFIPELPA